MSIGSLKSQDVLLLSKLVVLEGNTMKQKDLSQSLGINQSEVSTGLERLEECNLLDSKTKAINKMQVFEFLESAVKFFYPAKTLDFTIGIPTSIYGGEISKRFAKNEKTVARVWPDADGKVRGLGINPIHDSAPFACKEDEKLYNLLCALDVMRTFSAGRAKEEAKAAIRKAVFGSKNE